MSDSNKLDEILEVTSQVLIRCFFLGAVVLLVWLGVMWLAGDLAYRVHSSLFPMSREQFDLVLYCGMLITKLMILVLFLCPYLGIRLAIKQRGK